MPNGKKKYDIYDRTFKFAVKTVKFLEKLPRNTASIEHTRQLIRSSGAIGANLAEADGALTKKDFVNKIGIARRETRESKHWLRLIESTSSIKGSTLEDELSWLIDEVSQILLILSSIIRNTEKNH